VKPKPQAEEVQQIAVLFGCRIGPLTGRTSPEAGTGQSHEHGAAGGVVDVADQPAVPFLASVGEIMHVAGTGRITSWTTISANVTPTAELDVYGTVSATRFTGDGSGLTNLSVSGDRIVSGTSNVIAHQNGSLTFTTAGSQRMTIGVNGGVGIDTAAPSSTLHVAGKSQGHHAAQPVSGRMQACQ
jgi:hypothetical protein